MAPKVPTIITVYNAEDVTRHLNDLVPALNLPETEDSWEKISVALQHLTALTAGGACDYPASIVPFLKAHSRPFTTSLQSERSRLSAAATEALSAIATGLGPDFEPLIQLYFPVLLQLCARPNKVFVSRAKQAIHVVIEQTQLPALLRPLCEVLKDKSVTLRLIALEGVLACVNSLSPPELEKDVRATAIEGAIKATATDAAADVRKVARQVFDAYSVLMPARVPTFTANIDATTRKYLNVSSSAVPSRPASQASTRSRPASSLAHHPPPRPATSMSARSLTASASSASLTSKKEKEKGLPLARSMNDVALSSKEKEKAQIKEKVVEKEKDKVPPRRALTNDMPPPSIVPARRPVPHTATTSSRREPGRPHAAPPLSRSGSAPVRPEASTGPVARDPATLVRPEKSHGPARARPEASTTSQSTREKLMGSAGARRVVGALGPEDKKVSPAIVSHEERPVAGPSTNTARQRTKSRPPPFKPTTTTSTSTVPATAPPTKSTFAAPTASSTRSTTTTKPAVPKASTATSKPAPFAPKPAPRDPLPAPTKLAPKPVIAPKASTRIPPAAKPPGYAPPEPKKRADPTQPTLSQLARMNANAASKPAPAASRTTTCTGTRPLALRNKAKPGFVPKKREVVKEAAVEAVDVKADVEVEVAAEVPLPKTPEAVDVPLPASPRGAMDIALVDEEEEDVKEDAEVVEVEEAPEESDAVEEADEELDAVEVPLPASPHDTQPNSPISLPPSVSLDTATPIRTHSHTLTEPDMGKTPISSLVAAIQRGFLPTPGGAQPLSPPANYAAPGETWNGWPAGMGAFAQDLTPRGNRLGLNEGEEGDETMDMSICGEGWKVNIAGMPGYEGYEEEGSRIVLGEMGLN